MTHQQKEIPATRADLFAELKKVNQIIERVQDKMGTVASIISGTSPELVYDRLSALEDKWMAKQGELVDAIRKMDEEASNTKEAL